MSYEIGRVYRESYESESGTKEKLVMDIRTMSLRKKVMISVNKSKYPGGDVSGVAVPEREKEPDYLLWASFAVRKEQVPPVIVGHLSNAVGERGPFKSGVLFDPFLSPYEIAVYLFPPANAKTGAGPAVLYRVVSYPFGSTVPRSIPVVNESVAGDG